jgi:cation diffusion facilitator CzcD-associated flavoprotein CzcO
LQLFIVGAGFGGLLFAVRLLQTGFCLSDEILLVDKAGGFGGTWWWNKYPGLTCDVESYIYMPLLEETNYTPSHKYVSGIELKEHAERIANQWNLKKRVFFGTKVDKMDWNNEDAQWRVHITKNNHLPMILKSDIVIMANGLLTSQRYPKLNGLDTYKGHVFHTSRWDYAYTGGSQDNPTMDKLHDKTVGFVGTGATAVQAIPHLAQWAKKVIVFQRMPSSVDVRGNSVTDLTWWKTMIQEKGPGWQRGRMENFNSFISNDPQVPDVNLVDDAWTRLQTFSALIGSRSSLQPQYLTQMKRLDLHRQERIHHRVEATVTDPATAELLKPWYPSWCKRPCFSDNFLAAFNRPNVSLIDTKGKGVQTVSDRGIVVDGTEYDLDTIIFGTGYSVGSNANVEHVPVIGRGNQTLQQKWGQDGMASLHGIMTFGFPNLFFPGPYQAGATANQVYLLDQLEESEVFKAARSCIWGQGIKSYVETIEEWRQNSRLAGLDIQYR